VRAPLRRPLESNILLVSLASYQCLRIAKFGFERGMTPILGMTTARRKALSATPLSGDHFDPQTGSFASPPRDGFALSLTSIKQAVRSYRKCLRYKTDGRKCKIAISRKCKIAIKRFGACSYRSREQMQLEMLRKEDLNLDLKKSLEFSGMAVEPPGSASGSKIAKGSLRARAQRRLITLRVQGCVNRSHGRFTQPPAIASLSSP
jgi:hypothetical protein